MILKRQDLLGEQGNYLQEEALAHLSKSEQPMRFFEAKPPADTPREPQAAPSEQNRETTEMPITTAPPQNLFVQPQTAVAEPAPRQNYAPASYSNNPATAPNVNVMQNNQAPAPAPRLETRAAPSSEGRRLVVGPDISLNGEISTCDILVVEGNVQAVLKDCRQIEIAPHGHFKGNAEIDDAVISGLYEGNLVVRGRLHLAATGRIRGSVRYNAMQVDMGGEISGDIESLNAAAPRAANAPKQAAPQQQRPRYTGFTGDAAASGSY